MHARKTNMLKINPITVLQCPIHFDNTERNTKLVRLHTHILIKVTIDIITLRTKKISQSFTIYNNMLGYVLFEIST